MNMKSELLHPSTTRNPGFRLALRAAALLLPVVVTLETASAQTWSGPSFREYAGVNQAGTGEALYTNALSWNRHDISWSSMQPTNGSTWTLTDLNNAASEIQTLATKNVRLLPVLGYCTNWAADLSSRQWTLGNDKWTIAPGSGGTMVYQQFNIATGALVWTKTLTDFSKFPPANVANWTAYVQKVVSTLHAAPYNQQYFQIWNEAQEKSGFWIGSMDDYIQKIHLPAAQVIHNAGGKVVYGGWPVSGGVDELIAILDRNNAWGSLDVIDTHYFGSDVFPTLRAAADSRGYPGLAIWQTEIGFTTDFAYVPAAYTKRLNWALKNNWTQDKYKALYFADWAPNDPAAYGYNCSLNSGSALSGHGQCLQALAGLLGGSSTLNTFPGVTSTPALTDSLSATSCMEVFAAGNTIVIATNLGTSDYNAVASMNFSIPVARANITKAERVGLTGTRVDITASLSASGSNTSLTGVTVKDPTGSSARTWNDATSGQRTFYTVITLNGPAVSKFETENLSIAAQTAGVTQTTGTDSHFSNNTGTFFPAVASGQYITYTVPNITAGTYDVRVGVKQYSVRGTWQLAISRLDQLNSPTNVGSPFDEYFNGTQFTEVDLGLWTPGTTSDKAFRFLVTGKNASSGGYDLSFDYITLIRK